MLAYNLSPSFSWDTTGMSEDEMRAFPTELGKLGYVFNFITYGGHQIDGLAAEEFSVALQEDGMLALARLQRKFRLTESPYKTPQTYVGGPRLDGALTASSGRTATTKAMGKGSTQFQHLVETEVPAKLLETWLGLWAQAHDVAATMKVRLRPHSAGSELLELSVWDEYDNKIANVVFASIQDRRGRRILSIRNQNTLRESYRKKRFMTLMQLFMIKRFKSDSIHYVSPTEDNQHQTQGMQRAGLFTDVTTEVGDIIVASVDRKNIAEITGAGDVEVGRLIRRER